MRVFDVGVVLGYVFVGVEPESHEDLGLAERDRGAVFGEGYADVGVGAGVAEGRGGEGADFEGGSFAGG